MIEETDTIETSTEPRKTWAVTLAEIPGGAGGSPMDASSSGEANLGGGGNPVVEVDWSDKSREMADKLRAFEDRLVQTLNRKLAACWQARENYGFSRDISSARVMAEARSRITINANGEPVWQAGESNAQCGIQLGFSAQGIDYARARLYRDLYEASERAYVVSARADKQENTPVVETLTAMIDHLLRQAEHTRTANIVCGEAPTTGTGFERLEAISPLVMERDPITREWTKVVKETMFTTSSWRVENVLPTDLTCNRPEMQEGIFWITRDVTISQLLADQAVYVQQPLDEDGTSTYERVAGKYFNLRYLWERQPVQSYGVYDSTNWGYSQVVSDDEVLVRVEYEGKINFRDFVRDDVLTVDILNFFGIRIGMGPPPLDPKEMDSYKRELGFRASEISWTVGWVVRRDMAFGNATYGGIATTWVPTTDGDLVCFDDGRNRKGPNTLYRYPWIDSAGMFLGQGVPRRGMEIEYQANGIANALVNGSMMASNPCVFLDGDSLPPAIIGDVTKEGLVPGKAYNTKVNPEDVFKPYAVPFDAKGFDTITRMFAWFQQVTEIGPEVKGQDKPSTGTLGELQIDVAAAGVFFARIVLDHARENFRMIRDMLETYEMIVGREGVLRLANKVAPLFAKDFSIHYNSMEQLMDEYALVHPSILGANRVMLFEQMLKLFTAAGTMPNPEDPTKLVMPPDKFVKNMLGIASIREITSWTDVPSKIVPVEDQHRMFAQGNYMSPGVMDPHEVEIPEHLAEIDAVLAGIVTTGTEDGDIAYLRLLTHHVEEHMQKQMERDVMMQIQGTMTPGGAPGGAGDPATMPPDENDGMNNVARQATSGIPSGANAIPA